MTDEEIYRICITVDKTDRPFIKNAIKSLRDRYSCSFDIHLQQNGQICGDESEMRGLIAHVKAHADSRARFGESDEVVENIRWFAEELEQKYKKEYDNICKMGD